MIPHMYIHQTEDLEMTDGIPTISITFERMKQSIAHCISEQDIQFDQNFKAAMEIATSPENIARVINEQVKREVENQLHASVKNHFQYGEGRQFIDTAVQTSLADLTGSEPRAKK